MLDLPVDRLQDLGRLLVGLDQPAKLAVQSPRPPVLGRQRSLHSAVLHDHELPALAVRGGRRFQGQLQTSQHDAVVDRARLDPADRPLSEHCLGQRHGQAGLDIAGIAGWSQGVVHARVSLSSRYLSSQSHRRSGTDTNRSTPRKPVRPGRDPRQIDDTARRLDRWRASDGTWYARQPPIPNSCEPSLGLHLSRASHPASSGPSRPTPRRSAPWERRAG